MIKLDPIWRHYWITYQTIELNCYQCKQFKNDKKCEGQKCDNGANVIKNLNTMIEIRIALERAHNIGVI